MTISTDDPICTACSEGHLSTQPCATILNEAEIFYPTPLRLVATDEEGNGDE